MVIHYLGNWAMTGKTTNELTISQEINGVFMCILATSLGIGTFSA